MEEEKSAYNLKEGFWILVWQLVQLEQPFSYPEILPFHLLAGKGVVKYELIREHIFLEQLTVYHQVPRPYLYLGWKEFFVFINSILLTKV